ncbi:class I SAM-dependent methyltransferase [Roseibium album]|uniref:class I SAM-dependent methyltransferase n=1 Tax=Roseibium album TaxID=311410 RepID=UPI000CF16A54|nr:SAM-dependent methyltransferase [Labrenzia sp. EL_142]MBG6200943.1 SAM-dependent methyltransferase [Labrenzia sp. EL_13]
METETGIFETLERLGLASLETRETFATSTRDREGLPVYRDSLSGVVYIDGFYVGDSTYEDGAYRQETVRRAGSRDFELQKDTRRRVEAYSQFYTGKTVTEFGCGEGAFLRNIAENTLAVSGVELQADFIKTLMSDGFSCFDNPAAIASSSQDAVFAFHVLEHIPDPLQVLADLSAILKSGGIIVVEVPHADDFLLSQLKSDPFRKFTLWSQHLILHTRDSLHRMLKFAGFTDIVIDGVQRYPLSNHLKWLAEGQPGGHKGVLSALDTPELSSAYEAALRKIDATDTLVAVARKP